MKEQLTKNQRNPDYPIHPLILNRWSPRAMTGEPLSDEEQTMLTILLSDAFSEFVARRTPELDYVQNRYPHLIMRESDLGQEYNVKVNQVMQRNVLAKKLRHAAFTVKVKEVPAPHVTHAVCQVNCGPTCPVQP